MLVLGLGEVPYLPDKEIAASVQRFLADCGEGDSLPIPVDEIVEFKCKLDIVPHPHLRDCEVESFLAWEPREIWIDERRFDYEARYRFSLAHELGHFVLHEDVFCRYSLNSREDFITFRENSDAAALSRLETQAYIFAGLLLVPPGHLREQFERHLDVTDSLIAQAKQAGVGREVYLEYVLDAIIQGLRPVFLASQQCLEKRIGKDGLAELIP